MEHTNNCYLNKSFSSLTLLSIFALNPRPRQNPPTMKRDFLRLLKELEEDELREELRMLYDRFPVLREYYKLELSANTAQVLEKYKKDVRKAFFTGRRRMGKRGRSNSNKILKAFSEVSIHAKDLVQLHLYRVEVMIEAIHYYGVTNESFHDSTVKSFANALKLAKNEVLLDGIQEDAERLVVLFHECKNLHWFSLSETMREYY